jgi:predicted nucleotidyltransferase
MCDSVRPEPMIICLLERHAANSVRALAIALRSERPSLGNKRRRDECDPELSHNGDMVTLDTLRAERRAEILRLAERRGAHSLRVFGSVARGDANEDSDLDLLVAWEPGRSLMDHAGLVQDLQELLGMKVHVGTEKSLHWYVRDRILREATPL